MDYNKMVKETEEKCEYLSPGLGLKYSELVEKGYSAIDIKKIEASKKTGTVKFEGGIFKATELAASVALDLFIASTNDDDIEFVIEEELNTRSDTDFVDSVHFMKNFDEDEWTCYYTKTTYGLKGPNEFLIKEIGPEDKTDELEVLVRHVQSYDKRFTENKSNHILNQYHFQNGELFVFGEH